GGPAAPSGGGPAAPNGGGPAAPSGGGPAAPSGGGPAAVVWPRTPGILADCAHDWTNPIGAPMVPATSSKDNPCDSNCLACAHVVASAGVAPATILAPSIHPNASCCSRFAMAGLSSLPHYRSPPRVRQLAWSGGLPCV